MSYLTVCTEREGSQLLLEAGSILWANGFTEGKSLAQNSQEVASEARTCTRYYDEVRMKGQGLMHGPAQGEGPWPWAQEIFHL